MIRGRLGHGFMSCMKNSINGGRERRESLGHPNEEEGPLKAKQKPQNQIGVERTEMPLINPSKEHKNAHNSDPSSGVRPDEVPDEQPESCGKFCSFMIQYFGRNFFVRPPIEAIQVALDSYSSPL